MVQFEDIHDEKLQLIKTPITTNPTITTIKKSFIKNGQPLIFLHSNTHSFQRLHHMLHLRYTL